MNDMKDSLSVDQLLTDLEQMQDQIESLQEANIELQKENMELIHQKKKADEAVAFRDDQLELKMNNFRYHCIEEAERRIQDYVHRERHARNLLKQEVEKEKLAEAKARRNMFFCLCSLAFLAAYIFTDIVPWRPFFLPGIGEAIVFWWFVFGTVMIIIYRRVMKEKRQ